MHVLAIQCSRFCWCLIAAMASSSLVPTPTPEISSREKAVADREANVLLREEAVSQRERSIIAFEIALRDRERDIMQRENEFQRSIAAKAPCSHCRWGICSRRESCYLESGEHRHHHTCTQCHMAWRDGSKGGGRRRGYS